MTTNLHDKMLAAIDAYFSASDAVEEEVAENLLLDVRDELLKQPAQPAPTEADLMRCWVEKPNGEIDGIASMKKVLEKFGSAQQPAQQEPVLWQILNGVCHAGVRSTENLAKEAAEGMQKTHDLGGSLAAFHVRPLYTAHGITKGNT